MRQLFINGIFDTQDPSCPRAEAAAVEDGRFLAVGSGEQILRYRETDTEVIDLEGAAVYPGLIDSHMHLLDTAASTCGILLNDVHSRAEVLHLIRERARIAPPGQVIEGFRFNEDLWEDDHRLITAQDLDRIVPEHPVRLVRCCGHMLIANHSAIRLAGVNEHTVFPASSTADLDSGIFTEDAIPLLTADRKDQGVEKCMQLLQLGMQIASSAGLTGVFTDDFGAAGFSMQTVAEAYRRLSLEGDMPVRILQQCYLPAEEDLQQFLSSGFEYMGGNDFYRFGPRKLYADGGIGARTAWLTRPYADQPDTCGVPVTDEARLTAQMVSSHAAGMPVVVHAIGDAAVECVLSSVEAARKALPERAFLRDGVIHVQITSRHTLDRIREVKADIYAQPVFLEYDLHICENRVGAELAAQSYHWKTMLKEGVCISSGSDSPVETLSAAKNIHCAVNRQDFAGLPKEGWHPEERLTVEEAILCHTLLAARAGNLEDRLGSITPGKLADMTVYPHPFDTLSREEIQFQVPAMTVVGGRIFPHKPGAY